jgi:hypothetical protein
MNPSRSHPGRGRGCCDPHEGEGVVVYFGEPIRSGYALIRPLSDYGQDGAAILYKAWVCDSPTCGYNLRIDRGEVTYGDLPQQKSAQEPHRGTAARAVAS